MFTGLIEAVCNVKSISRSAGGALLTIDSGSLADEIKTGDSIAVNGVCLTAARLRDNIVDFDISGETLAKSNFDRLTAGSKVNVELSMKATGRFGGHIVTGHVDGTATIEKIDRQSQFANMKFAADAGLLGQMVAKGSVAVDGISLTVANIDQSSFSAALIPQTLGKTTLGNAKVGDVVNIEIDMIVKAVKKQLEKILPQKQPLTIEQLRQAGF